MEEDKIFQATGNVEEEIKALESIDPNLIFAKINKAGLQVQRILDLFEDVYVVCHMTTALKLQHEKLKDLHEKIENKIIERQNKINQEDKSYAKNIRKEEEGSLKRNLVEAGQTS